MLDPDGRPVRGGTAFDDPAYRMNDGGTDRQGRFFCGSMAYDMADPRGALYRYDADGTIAAVLTGVTISNGIAWSADGGRCTTSTPPPSGWTRSTTTPPRGRPTAVGRWSWSSRTAGMPDGLALDDEGGVWVALWHGAAVHRYRADGRLDAVVELPVELVTACAFGGPALDELYITTSREGLTSRDPAAGALFTVRPGVRGLPCTPFDG